MITIDWITVGILIFIVLLAVSIYVNWTKKKRRGSSMPQKAWWITSMTILFLLILRLASIV